MPDKLFFGVRMLALTQPREVLCLNFARELPLLGEPALPFRMALLIAAPVVLFLRGKLTRMINTSLAGRQRFRDREHGRCLGAVEPEVEPRDEKVRLSIAFFGKLTSPSPHGQSSEADS